MAFIVMVLLLVGGAVLKFVEPPFFEQAHQMGFILMISGCALVALQVLLAIYAKTFGKRWMKKAQKRSDDIHSNWPGGRWSL